MDEEQDAKLVHAALSGDRDAFGALVERHQKMAFGVCYRMTGNIPDAEDLAHDAFVEAYLKLKDLRDPAKFGAWLRTLTLNLCRMWYRRRKRERVGAEAEEPIVDQEIENQDSHARLSFGLSRLSASHRLVLVLHYLEGLPYEEVATFLDIPVGTVMSRLHRARAALKDRMDEVAHDEDIPMIPDDEFKEEVDAEIAVLLRMFGEDAGAAERLSVILRRSPDRFAELLRQTDDEETLEHLSLLVARLGSAAMEAALRLCLSPDESARFRVRALLARALSRSKPLRARGFRGGTASREGYFLAERLIALTADEAEKADLLVELMVGCEEIWTAVLLENLLVCFRDAAFPLLMERFCEAADTEELYRHPRVLYALCRTGRRFGEALTPLLAGRDIRETLLALAGVEAIARSLDPVWLEKATPQQFMNEARTVSKWPPLRREDLGETLVESLAEHTAALLNDECTAIRDSALCALGHLRAWAHVEQIKACASHEEPSTRRAAILSLAEIGDRGCVDVLMAAAREGNPSEQLAAVEALGRLQVTHATSLLIELLHGPDGRIRKAAVVALGEMGGEDAHNALEDLLHSPDKQLKKAAAKVLYGGRTSPGYYAATETSRRRVQKVRGGARPVAHISMDAAIRFAMPEMRPYDEREFNRRIAQVCSDHAATRRYLVDLGLMTRDDGLYELTELGQAVWRVEHFIMERYLTP